jgi:hypothetical protein
MRGGPAGLGDAPWPRERSCEVLTFTFHSRDQGGSGGGDEGGADAAAAAHDLHPFVEPADALPSQRLGIVRVLGGRSVSPFVPDPTCSTAALLLTRRSGLHSTAPISPAPPPRRRSARRGAPRWRRPSRGDRRRASATPRIPPAPKHRARARVRPLGRGRMVTFQPRASSRICRPASSGPLCVRPGTAVNDLEVERRGRMAEARQPASAPRPRRMAS